MPSLAQLFDFITSCKLRVAIRDSGRIYKTQLIESTDFMHHLTVDVIQIGIIMFKHTRWVHVIFKYIHHLLHA